MSVDVVKADLKAVLASLKLGTEEAARLLGVSERTVRRWMEGEEPPGPARAALDAWHRLAEHRLPWRPDEFSIRCDDRDQIWRMREHTQELAALIKHVEARGGPRNPWTVDLESGRASFGPFNVSFYRLANGGYSLASYSRADRDPDLSADRRYLEDASYCIARELSKVGPVRESLQAVARYVRENSAYFARDQRMPPSHEAEKRRRAIETVADALDRLAVDRRTSYAQFEELLKHLHGLGLFPEIALVSDVARAFAGLAPIAGGTATEGAQR